MLQHECKPDTGEPFLFFVSFSLLSCASFVVPTNKVEREMVVCAYDLVLADTGIDGRCVCERFGANTTMVA